MKHDGVHRSYDHTEMIQYNHMHGDTTGGLLLKLWLIRLPYGFNLIPFTFKVLIHSSKIKRSPHDRFGQAQKGDTGKAPTHSQPDTRRWGVSTMLWPLYPCERPSIHHTGGCMALWPAWMAQKISTSPGFNLDTVLPIVNHYTDYDILAAFKNGKHC
jgi:hypothetical protein